MAASGPSPSSFVMGRTLPKTRMFPWRREAGRQPSWGGLKHPAANPTTLWDRSRVPAVPPQGHRTPHTFEPHQLVVTLLAELQLPPVLAQQLPVGAVHLLDGLADLGTAETRGSASPQHLHLHGGCWVVVLGGSPRPWRCAGSPGEAGGSRGPGASGCCSRG